MSGHPVQPGVRFARASQKDQAMALLQTLLAAHPDHGSQAQYQLGKELLAKEIPGGHPAPGAAAARLDPQDDYIHYQLQAAYRKAGRTADADKELAVYRDIKAKAGSQHSSAKTVEAPQAFHGRIQRRRLLS